MAQNTGTTVTAPIVKNDSNDQYAAIDTNAVKGGPKSYATQAELYAVGLYERDWGMKGHVWNDGVNNGNFELTYAHADTSLLNNANWKRVVYGSTEPPPTEFTLFQLLSGGDYNYDLEIPSDEETSYYELAPQNGTDEAGDPFAIVATPFVVDHTTAEGLTRYDVPVILLDGTFDVITGEEGPARVYPPIPATVGKALTPIVVEFARSYKYTDNDPTRGKDGLSGEVRNFSVVFEELDTQKELNGATVDEHYDKTLDMFEDSDTVTKEEGVRPSDGKRVILFHGAAGGTDYVLPLMSDTVRGGAKIGLGLVMDGEFLNVLATSNNFIYLSPTGDDGTGARGNVGAPFASIAAAKAVYTTGDVISVNPGVYTGQADLAISGQDPTYQFSPGADMAFTSWIVLATGGDTVTVRGSGTLRGDVGANTSAILDLEFDEIVSAIFSLNTSATGRFKGRHLSISNAWAVQNSASTEYTIEQIDYTGGSPLLTFNDFDHISFNNGIINSSQVISIYQSSGTPVNFSALEFHLMILNIPSLQTQTGAGITNGYNGRVLLENTILNATGDAIVFQKYGSTVPNLARIVFNNATLNAGVGFYAMRATLSSNYQTALVPIEILSGGLTINADVIYIAGREIINQTPGTRAFRTNYSGSAPALSQFSSIYTIDEPGTGGGGGGDADTLGGVAAADYALESYADAKVADAINDGTTTIAPSQNAVFDALALKSPVASPTFTGTPAAPTASTGTNTTQVATTAFVSNSLQAYTSANIIPSLLNLKMWVAPRLEVGYTDGTARARVPDFSGYGFALAQATGANQPLFKTAIVNSLPVYRFDGTNDILAIGSNTLIQNVGGITFHLVYRRLAGTGVQVPFSVLGTTVGFADLNFIVNSPSSASVRMAARRVVADAAVTSDFTQADTNFHIVSVKVDFSLGELTMYMDGVRQTTVTMVSVGNSENTASSGIALGGQNNSLFFNGDVAELVFCTAPQPEETILSVWTYLKGIYGL